MKIYKKINISLIAAKTSNNVIGLNNKIPWNLNNDIKWFKKNTIKKTIIMGNNTYNSINQQPLPDRNNIVLTKKKKKSKNVIYVNSIQEALRIIPKQSKEIMVIGGEKIYNLFFPIANKLYLTNIEINIFGDKFFPTYSKQKWKTIFKEKHKKNKNNKFNYSFEILKLI